MCVWKQSKRTDQYVENLGIKRSTPKPQRQGRGAGGGAQKESMSNPTYRVAGCVARDDVAADQVGLTRAQLKFLPDDYARMCKVRSAHGGGGGDKRV